MIAFIADISGGAWCVIGLFALLFVQWWNK